MKRNILLTFMFITLFFIGSNDVNAALKCTIGQKGCTQESVEEYVKSRSNSELVCLYEVELNTEIGFYNYIYYSKYENVFYAGTTYGSFEGDQHLKKNDNAYLLGSAYDLFYSSYQCPENSYIAPGSLLQGVTEICFDNNGECKNDGKKLNNGTNFNDTKSSVPKFDNADTMKYYGLNWESSCQNENIPNEYKNGGVCRYSAVSGASNEDKGEILLFYNNQKNMIIYVDHSGRRTILEGNDSSKIYNSSYTDIFTYKNKITNNINYCPESLYYNESKEVRGEVYHDVNFSENATNNADKIIKYELNNCETGNNTPIPNDTCETLIKPELQEIINDIMTAIRIIVPLLLVGLITYDFAMAVLSGADDKVSKIKARAIKRIVIAIIIFFVPTFINLIFNIVNEVWGSTGTKFSTCGITENNE